MKVMSRVLAVLTVLVMLAATTTVLADDSYDLAHDGFSTSYTYNYDYWGDIQMSPDAYRVEKVIDSITLGLENLENIRIKKAQSLFVIGNDMYICDTGNNRVIQTRKIRGEFQFVRLITTSVGTEKDFDIAEDVYTKVKIYEGLVKDVEAAEKKLADLTDPKRETPAPQELIEAAKLEVETLTASRDEAQEIAVEAQDSAREAGCRIWQYPAWQKDASGQVISVLNTPNDIAVDSEGYLYIADTANNRVLKMDKDFNLIWEFTKPLDNTFDQRLEFQPKKVVVDVKGRVYALCANVNKGLAKFEEDGTFSGFIGANKVSVNMAEYIFKRYFMTKEQRAASESFVPTEYENIYIDTEGFIYATNTIFSEYDLKSDAAKPIRRLNSLGDDILIKNDRYPPIGDIKFTEQNSKRTPSRLTDVTVLKNDIYVACDRTRGRLFGYDSQGVMLWAFGTKGNIEGAFTSAISVEHMGYDLMVLDQQENSVTVFTPTEYGMMIYDAIESYLDGRYDESADLWENVMKMNANYPLAFRGIGRAILRQNDYEGAMEYFKMAHDQENYGRAFKLYRKEWIEKNIWWIVLILALLLIIPLVRGRIKRLKWEVIAHEHSKVRH